MTLTSLTCSKLFDFECATLKFHQNDHKVMICLCTDLHGNPNSPLFNLDLSDLLKSLDFEFATLRFYECHEEVMIYHTTYQCINLHAISNSPMFDIDLFNLL